MPKATRLLIALTAPFCLLACGEEPDVETYTAQRDAPPPTVALTNSAAPAQAAAAASTSAPGGTSGSTQGGSQHSNRTELTWAVPSGWEQAPGNGFRVATLQPQAGTESVSVAVTYLANDRSDLVGNINRWRGQIGLAPVGTDEIAADQHAFSSRAGLTGHYIDLQGRDDRMIVAWFKFPDGAWYFKMTGDNDDVANNVTTMRQFAGSITRTGAGTPPQDTTPTAGDVGEVARSPVGPDDLQTPAETQDFAANGLSGKAPSAWNMAENTPMLLMNFETADNCRVTVSSFPGNVGGREANLGRWVRQLGLSAQDANINERNLLFTLPEGDLPVDAFEIVPIELNASSKASIIATIRDAEKTFFIKITGDAQPVAMELQNFLYFISELKLPLVKPLPPEGWR